jgi:hypothetical protein
LLSEVPQLAGTGIERAAMLVVEITTGDHSKSTTRRERARFRAAQRVLAIAVAHGLAVGSAGQVEMAGEHVAWIGVERAVLAFTVRTAGVIPGVTSRIARISFAGIAGSSVEARRIVMAVTRARGRPAPVVVSFVITIEGAAVVAVSCSRGSREPLLVARVVVPRIRVHSALHAGG